LTRKDIHIYEHPDVSSVRELHAGILESFDYSDSILGLLDRMAGNLYEANAAGDPRSLVEIRNFLNSGAQDEKEEMARIALSDAREIMARQHGFADWEEAKYGGRNYLQPEFETAVDLLVSGKIKSLEQILNDHPHLVIQRSAFYHKASLLHYVSANGVEIRRQTVPQNLPEIVSLLITVGAEKDARGYFYGRMMDTESLILSGAHTQQAGVYEKILHLLNQ
jgi:hypothetical protein